MLMVGDVRGLRDVPPNIHPGWLNSLPMNWKYLLTTLHHGALITIKTMITIINDHQPSLTMDMRKINHHADCSSPIVLHITHQNH